MVSDLRRTWSVNSAELEPDIRVIEFNKSDGNNKNEYGNVIETGILLLKILYYLFNRGN